MRLAYPTHTGKRCVHFASAARALLVCLLSTGIALAESKEVVIQDSSGIERARGELDEVGKIEFSLTDASGAPAQGAEITLTNSISGEIISTQSVDGIAAFQGVAPGSWTVASVTPGITFTEIQVGAVSALAAGGGLGALSATTVAGGAVAVGGATVGISAATNSSSNNDPLSPST